MSEKHFVEQRFESKRNADQIQNKTATIPGRRLLLDLANRSNVLNTRLRALSSVQRTRMMETTPATFPGMQFRDTLPAGIIPDAAVTGDFNRDGHMDFVIANGWTDELWIYFGRGDGTFEMPRVIPLTKGVSPVYMLAADLRGNGILDLVVAEFDTSTVGVLLGKGDGTFAYEQIYSVPQPPQALAVDDFNRDGKLDIVASMSTQSSDVSGVSMLATLYGDGTGALAAPIITKTHYYSHAWNVASGDVNGDGLPDLIITGPAELDGSQIYLNAANGTFTQGQMVAWAGPLNVPLDGRLADLNEDGCLDAVVADANSSVLTRMGDCTGNFGPQNAVQMGDSNSAVRVVDLNGDGHLDIVTTAVPLMNIELGDIAGDTLSVSFGDGHGNFTTGRNYVGKGESYSLDLADFNEDGKLDVITSNTDTDNATVYLNDGSGGFGFPQGLFVGLPGVGTINAPVSMPSFGDLNGDGRPDVVLVDEGYNGEYFAVSMLNDGTGRFSGPIVSDTGANIGSNWMGDYRLGDFRNTGRLDFVAVALGLNSGAAGYVLFMAGNGDGTFGKPTFTPTLGAAGVITTGDFNRDGKLDFVVVGTNGPSQLLTPFLGNGDGTFQTGRSLSFQSPSTSRVFAGDFNHDGNLDVLVYDTSNGYWTTSSVAWEILGNGDGSFRPARQVFSPAQPLTVADMNGDHGPDILTYDYMWPDGLTTTPGPARFTTYLDQPDGSFLKASSYAPYAGVPASPVPFFQFGDPSGTSMATDLNGDGKLDALAFQHVSENNLASYAQILMGNGDGTQTPTYDIFSFSKLYSFPRYAHDLDGDGRTDLLELDNSTSSMQVFKSAPAPALQLEFEDERVVGNSGCGWLFPNVPSASDRSVTLSSSVPGVMLPSSVSIPANSLSQRFCYTLDSSFDWHRVFDVRAQLGTDVAVAYASQSYVVGFSETISPKTIPPIYPTQTTEPITVSVTAAPGYSSTIRLRCDGLPEGDTCEFGSDTLTPQPGTTATTTVVVHATAPTSPFGGSTVAIVAEDDNVVRRQYFALNVPELLVSVFGPSDATSPGLSSGSATVIGIRLSPQPAQACPQERSVCSPEISCRTRTAAI